MNNITYFWGKEDTSVHFCESKYTHVSWIAEFYNTISCLFYVLAGMVLWKLQHQKKIGLSLISIGLGSIMLHMTLRYYGQWFDEISMLVTSFFGLQKIKKNISKFFLVPITILYYNFHNYFSYFLIVFAGSQLFFTYKSLHLIKSKTISLKKRVLLILYIQFFSIAIICWIADQLYCEEFKSYYIHAWWHFFTALAALCGFTAFEQLSVNC